MKNQCYKLIKTQILIIRQEVVCVIALNPSNQLRKAVLFIFARDLEQKKKIITITLTRKPNRMPNPFFGDIPKNVRDSDWLTKATNTFRTRG